MRSALTTHTMVLMTTHTKEPHHAKQPRHDEDARKADLEDRHAAQPPADDPDHKEHFATSVARAEEADRKAIEHDRNVLQGGTNEEAYVKRRTFASPAPTGTSPHTWKRMDANLGWKCTGCSATQTDPARLNEHICAASPAPAAVQASP